MQPEAESDASLDSIHSELRWVVVTVPWDCSVTESLADGVSWSVYGPALLCEHSWTDYEVLQALNDIDLLVTAPQKQARTQEVIKLVISLVWEVWTCNKLGEKGHYACHFVSQPVISHYNSQHMLAMNIFAILEIHYWRVFSWTKNCQISLAQPVHLLWVVF